MEPINEVTPLFSDSVYDNVKRLVQIVLPALGSLYFGLAQIWGLNYAEQVVGTLSVLAIFFGLVLGFSDKRYNASDAPFVGDIVYSEQDGKTIFTLGINEDPLSMIDKDKVTFKIKSLDQ